jgi:hypothetical protein
MDLQSNTIQNQDQHLKNIYNDLMKQRLSIKNEINQDNTLNAAYEDGAIYVTSKYYSYIALTFTAILLILLFLKFSTSGQQTGGGDNYLNNSWIFFLLIAGIFGYILYISTN